MYNSTSKEKKMVRLHCIYIHVLVHFSFVYWNGSTHVVYESFKDYVAVETLNGENKYDAGDHGLQVTVAFSLARSLTHSLTHSLTP